MTSKTKEFERIKNNPKNVSFQKLEGFLISAGFEESRPQGGSSHCTFTKGNVIVTIPFARPVKEVYVKHVIEAIESSGVDQNEKES